MLTGIIRYADRARTYADRRRSAYSVVRRLGCRMSRWSVPARLLCPGALMISFSCPTCGAKYSVKDEFAGRKTRCTKCKATIHVPAGGASVPVIVSAPEPKVRPTVVPVVVATQVGPAEASCPICGETIMAHAKRCKHCGETLDPAMRKAEEAERLAKQANKNSRRGRQSSTVVVDDGGTSGNTGSCILVELLGGFFCSTFGIGHFMNGQPGLGLLFMFGYWGVTFVNVLLMFVVIGFFTFPLCWILAMIVSPLTISATAKSRSSRLIVHSDSD